MPATKCETSGHMYFVTSARLFRGGWWRTHYYLRCWDCHVKRGPFASKERIIKLVACLVRSERQLRFHPYAFPHEFVDAKRDFATSWGSRPARPDRPSGDGFPAR